MRRAVGLVLALSASCPPILAGQSLRPVSASVGYGSHSSYLHPNFFAVQVGLDLGGPWTLAPTVRRATGIGGTGWRVHLGIERRLGGGWLQPYVGAGPSWTDELSSMDWKRSRVSVMVLAGVDLRLTSERPGQLSLRAFAEIDGFAFKYAGGQILGGLRLRHSP